MSILASAAKLGPYNLFFFFGMFWRSTGLMAGMVYFPGTEDTDTVSIGLWLLSHAQFISFELGA